MVGSSAKPRGLKFTLPWQLFQWAWINAVTVIQSAVRTLVFEGASVPEDSEVTKIRKMPSTDDYTVIYLDSYDELRRLDTQCAEALEGLESARHIRFKKLCERKGLPLIMQRGWLLPRAALFREASWMAQQDGISWPGQAGGLLGLVLPFSHWTLGRSSS